jgi:hypothetical protein
MTRAVDVNNGEGEVVRFPRESGGDREIIDGVMK